MDPRTRQTWRVAALPMGSRPEQPPASRSARGRLNLGLESADEAMSSKEACGRTVGRCGGDSADRSCRVCVCVLRRTRRGPGARSPLPLSTVELLPSIHSALHCTSAPFACHSAQNPCRISDTQHP